MAFIKALISKAIAGHAAAAHQSVTALTGHTRATSAIGSPSSQETVHAVRGVRYGQRVVSSLAQEKDHTQRDARRIAASARATARTATALQRDIQHSAPQSALAPAGRRIAASARATARTATALQRDIQHSAPQSALAPAGRRIAASARATARTATALQRDIQHSAPQSALAPAGRRIAASARATARTATALQRDIQRAARGTGRAARLPY